MFKQPFKHISDPIAKLLLRTVSIDNPWVRFEDDVPTELYGLGAHHEFSWYLEGESDLRISSIDEIVAWLSGCKYASDTEVFHEADFWQHPCTFEKLRIGDCEDFALWGWRKLIELGYSAEFVAGRSRQSNCPEGENPWSRGHAWVQYEDGGRRLVLDAVESASNPAIRPLKQVRGMYLPEVSVDMDLKRYVYGGFYLVQKAKNNP